jgi:Ser/Thr protein kinase RdoA (MazF antagonist)
MADPKGVPSSVPHIGPFVNESEQRAKFQPGELRKVLSHYDLPPVVEIRSFPRGSRRSPKARVVTRMGEFLLKRRAPGRDDPFHVAFTQEVEIYLNQRGYPAPRLLGTRDTNNSMLQLDGSTYELFEFIRGVRYDRTEEAAVRSGLALAHLHRLLAELKPNHSASTGGYHAAAELAPRLERAPHAVLSAVPGASEAEVKLLVKRLADAYHEAAQRASELGFSRWPTALCHGDWHPGNLLYRSGVIVGVLDFDSARREARMADVANGALQFSMRLGKMEETEQWPPGLDMPLLRAFLSGYDQASRPALGEGERSALPSLMIEALALESVVPIAATGMFGRIDGVAFLRMIARTIDWITQHADELTRPEER